MRDPGSSWPHEIGKALPSGHFKRGFGKKNQLIIPEILAWSDDPEEIERLGDRKEELYRELVAQGGMTVLPGARELLTVLKPPAFLARWAPQPRARISSQFSPRQVCGEFFERGVRG